MTNSNNITIVKRIEEITLNKTVFFHYFIDSLYKKNIVFERKINKTLHFLHLSYLSG